MATKQDRAYHFLRDAIVGGALLPGQRLLPGEIGRRLGMSGVPVREALLRLQSERLVTIEPHVGAVVALVGLREVAQTMTVLSLLEGYATRLARPHAVTLVGDLAGLNAEMGMALKRRDWDRLSHLNRAFHRRIYEVCDNDALVASIDALWTRLDGFMSATSFYLIPERAAGSVEEHARIVDMLSDPRTDPLQLELFAREHGLRTVKSLAQMPKLALAF
jgi:DNA-binding GntR family transcriptional regulator